MTIDEFRKMALEIPKAVELSRLGPPGRDKYLSSRRENEHRANRSENRSRECRYQRAKEGGQSPTSNIQRQMIPKTRCKAATRRFGKIRSRKLVETGRSRFRQFEIAK